MKIDDWLKRATKQLEETDAGTARLDCLVLLEDELGKSRAWVLANPDFEIPKLSIKKLEKQLTRREKHEPLAYIRGKTEFYGREFIINKDVLEPRPESETMIEMLKSMYEEHLPQLQRLDGVQGSKEKRTNRTDGTESESRTQLTQQSAKSTSRVAGSAGQQVGAALTIVDVGTGSGALAVTAKLELPQAEVIGTDIDPKCLEVARQNTQNFGVKIQFYRGDLLNPLQQLPPQNLGDRPNFVVLANLPYVPDNYEINRAALNEPRIAIFGGKDGLDLYRRLFEQIDKLKAKPKHVLTESLPFQHTGFTKIARKSDYKLQKAEDFIQVFELIDQ